MTEYNHLTNSKELDKRKYKQDEFSMKPRGLWCTVGNQWIKQLNNMDWGIPEKCFTVTLADDSNILQITVENAFDILREFSVEIVPGFKQISWKKVAEKYDGMLFLIPNRHELLFGRILANNNIDKEEKMDRYNIISFLSGMDIETSLVLWNLDKCNFGKSIPVSDNNSDDE